MAEQQTKTNFDSDPKSRKLKFAGICKLNNEELSSLYRIDQLTDEELASVGLERSSLIDDYRLLHELSMMKQMENEVTKSPAQTCKQKPMALDERFGKQMHECIPKSKYKFTMLSHLIMLMSLDKQPETIFSEQDLKIDADYHEDAKVVQLMPKERLDRRLESFYDHLEKMFLHGDRKKANDLVFNAIVRLVDRRTPLESRLNYRTLNQC
ncbi:uncharacterized protein LOC6554064 [Drosophila erecta]|uniref:GG18211 n=1 Tax=Drosophila erecta TaxID=7220 RepID=B3P4J6_DROER|nr:uncharacterized protein LOC6554064 [Drosophila erecta]EDV49511.1 uncharacterized protein Dere_GG18211 [Drosophila erecta]